jgi:hypothetical protein
MSIKSMNDYAKDIKDINTDLANIMNQAIGIDIKQQLISPVIQIVGDSTGNDNWDWPYLIGQKLALKYPNYNVKYTLYNPTKQMYGAWQDIQRAGEDRHVYAKYQTNYIPAYYLDSDVTKISPDLDISIKVALDNWQQTGNLYFISKVGNTGHNCWAIRLISNKIKLYWYPDGTVGSALNFDLGIDTSSFTPGVVKLFRVTLDVDNGAGGYTATAYTSTDGENWTQTATYTGVGTTTIFTDSTVNYAIASTATNITFLDGKYFEIILRDGINGANVLPQPIDACLLPANNTVTFGGTPTIYIFCGGISGSSVTDWNGTDYVKKATPVTQGAVLFINLSHNEAEKRNNAYLTEMDNLLNALRQRAIGANIFLCTQNPNISVANYSDNHKESMAVRRRMLMGWAKKNGIDIIDTYKAFVEDSRDLASLILDDGLGVHPNQDGQKLWTDTVWDYLKL